MKGLEWGEKALKKLEKYKYVLLVALVGVVLLLWPAGGKEAQAPRAALSERDGLELRLEEALSQVKGVGEVSLVLAGREGTAGYQGALVVAEGGDDPRLKLELSQIVAALTGLGTDKIRICKGK